MQQNLRTMERASVQRDEMLNDKEREVELLQLEMSKVSSEREFYWKQYLGVKHRLAELETDFYEHKLSSAPPSRYSRSDSESQATGPGAGLARLVGGAGGDSSDSDVITRDDIQTHR